MRTGLTSLIPSPLEASPTFGAGTSFEQVNASLHEVNILADGFTGFAAPLAFNDDALKLLENRKLLVGLVNFGFAALRDHEEVASGETVELFLDITGVLFDELGETAHVSLEIWVLGENHDDFAAHPRCDK